MHTFLARQHAAPDVAGHEESNWFPVLETIHLADQTDTKIPHWMQMLEQARSSPALNQGANARSGPAGPILLVLLFAGFICYAVGRAIGLPIIQ